MKTEKIKILIVDDDVEMCHLLCQYIEKQGFSGLSVNNAIELNSYLNTSKVDLIILDLMLPGENGLSILKRLQNQYPIIILSASGEDVDRIIGLEIGADDYLAKPFNPRELIARIRSVLRRKNSRDNNASEEPNKHFSFGQYIFDIKEQALYHNGKAVALTGGELSLLQIFVESPRQVLSRDNILEKIKGYDCAPFDRSIDVRIMRLRQKIEIDTTTPKYIQTVWGKGYKFVPDQATL